MLEKFLEERNIVLKNEISPKTKVPKNGFNNCVIFLDIRKFY